MANPYQPPGLLDESDESPPPREPLRYFWARLIASSVMLTIGATVALGAGMGNEGPAPWRAMGGPFWLMRETRGYALGGTLAIVCLLGMLAAMAQPTKYTLAIAFVALAVWAGCSALAWAIWSGVYLYDSDYIFRIGW